MDRNRKESQANSTTRYNKQGRTSKKFLNDEM